MSARIRELALPKGNVVPLCEICDRKATTKCERCRHTHYCSEYHRALDRDSFHLSVCEIVARIRGEQPLPFTEEDRREADDALLRTKRELQRLAEETARKWLLEGKPGLAYPPATSALNVARDLEAPGGLGTVHPACLVAESHLGSGDVRKAQEYAVLASWVCRNHEGVPPSTRRRLKRLVGVVCLATGKWTQAGEAFAEMLHAAAAEGGTSGVRVAVPHGLLGLSLLKLGDEEGAMAGFHEMADRWLEHLLVQYEKNTLRCATDDERMSDPEVRELEFEYMESKIVLRWSYEDIRHLGTNPSTDRLNFKMLCVQTLQQMREGGDPAVYRQEALATGTRTKQDEAVPEDRVPILARVLGQNYLTLWEEKNSRPRTVATKYLEMIKEINV